MFLKVSGRGLRFDDHKLGGRKGRADEIIR
jgi:hypothetical protein